MTGQTVLDNLRQLIAPGGSFFLSNQVERTAEMKQRKMRECIVNWGG
jgi:hypothetical protein